MPILSKKEALDAVKNMKLKDSFIPSDMPIPIIRRRDAFVILSRTLDPTAQFDYVFLVYKNQKEQVHVRELYRYHTFSINRHRLDIESVNEKNQKIMVKLKRDGILYDKCGISLSELAL